MPTGNAGLLSPYEQGVDHAQRGYSWQQIYDQPGEENEAHEYRLGYFNTIDKMYIKLLRDNIGKNKIG